MVRDTFLLFALVYVQFLTFSASLPASTTTNVILPRYGAPTSIPTITSAPIPNLALTTLFCPPINCLNSLTRLEARNGEIWWNEPLPVASTVNSECYASQFIASYTRHFAHALPAFDPLVCQANYVTITSALVEGRTYIACCPSDFKLLPPDATTATRPAYGAKCYSDITSTVVEVYDSKSFVSISTIVDMGEGTQAFAPLMDGFARVGPNNAVAAVTSSSVAHETGVPRAQASQAGATNSTSTDQSEDPSVSPAVKHSDDQSLSTAAKIGIGVGAGIGGPSVVAILVFLWWKYKKSGDEKQGTWKLNTKNVPFRHWIANPVQRGVARTQGRSH